MWTKKNIEDFEKDKDCQALEFYNGFITVSHKEIHPFMKSLIEKYIEFRDAKGWTDYRVAKEAGVSQPTARNMGIIGCNNLTSIRKIFKALDAKPIIEFAFNGTNVRVEL